MKSASTLVPLATLLALVAAGPGHAQVFGSLANFDVVNNTPHPAYGFEIEIEDSHTYKDSSSAYAHGSSNYVNSIFGYDRSFGGIAGGDPFGVVRFGTVNVFDYNDANGQHAGVRIQYGFAPDAATPVGVPAGKITPASAGGFSTPGESCWPGANINWTQNPCDHFGVTTTGSPAITRYNWVLDNGGTLARQPIGIPAVNLSPIQIVAQPGLPAQPALRAEIQAVAEPENGAGNQWGEALWIKTYITRVKDKGRGADEGNIDLGNLLLDNGQIEGRIEDIKTDMRIFQKAPANQAPDGQPDPFELEVDEVALADDDKSVIIRYEFFKFVAVDGKDFGNDGKVSCGNCEREAERSGLRVGEFVGRQIAGFNAVQPLAAPIPEPQTWAMMLAGLVGMGFMVRRRQPTA